MKNSSSPFKLIVLGVFGVFIVVGIIVFALSKFTSGSVANLTVWGTFAPDVFNELYTKSSIENNDNIVVKYEQKDVSDFDIEFINALAEGTGPDVVMLRDDSVYKHGNKLFTIPYKNFSERLFRDTFVEEGEVFLNKEGVTAFPLVVDPLVMYWNRDIFSNNQISKPPRYWDEVYPLIKSVTKRDNNGNIQEATLAMGEWRNIVNAKELLVNMLLQAGTPIVSKAESGVTSVLLQSSGNSIPPSEAAVNFYVQFANPQSDYYTWNRSLPNSMNMFLSGQLALYFGFSSEINSIQVKNSNLNFDVTLMPQARDTNKRTVYGRMYSLSITKQSKNISAAFTLVNSLIEPNAISALEKVTNLPPARRDLLANIPTDAFRSVFYNSALISKTWIDPEPRITSGVFQDMIESITSGKNRVTDALGRANAELTDELMK